MLYQLSYASTGKPSKSITAAIQLQAGFISAQDPCRQAFPTLPDYLSGALLCNRLCKSSIVHRNILLNIFDLDREVHLRSGLMDRERNLYAVDRAIIAEIFPEGLRRSVVIMMLCHHAN